ncbi:MAG: YHS domain-containing protein [Desulfobacteraceae bacterium]|nr:MAG: YHS domain-containing protein [Desulfobacteraceae bacterium]
MKFLLFIAAFYIFYRVLKIAWKVFTRPDREPDEKGPGHKVIDEMVQDPVCKTYIPRRDAVKKTIGGKELSFCSQECAVKYESRGDNGGR